MPVNGEKISILYYSKAAFDNITPNINSIYYVEEVDGSLSLYVGDKKVRGIEEAPSDNKSYSRRNQEWIDSTALLPERSYIETLGRLPRPGMLTDFYVLNHHYAYADAFVVNLITQDNEIHSVIITPEMLSMSGSYCDSSGNTLLAFNSDGTMDTTYQVITGSISVIMHGRTI